MTLSSKRVEGSSLQRKHKVPRLEGDTEDEDEWSKILSTAKMNEVKRIPMSALSRKKSTRELDIRGMSEDDLHCLKTSDPFLYYSIPGVRAAAVALEDVDHSDVDALCRGLRSQVSLTSGTKVARRSCISFECGMATALNPWLDGDLFENLSENGSSSLENEDLDVFLKEFAPTLCEFLGS